MTELGVMSTRGGGEFIIIIIGIFSRRVAIKALYHCGRLVELDVRQESDDLRGIRGDKTDARKDEERRGRGRTGSARHGNGGSQLVNVCKLWGPREP